MIGPTMPSSQTGWPPDGRGRHPLRRDGMPRRPRPQLKRQPLGWADLIRAGLIFGVAPLASLASIIWTEPLGVVGRFQSLPWWDWPVEAAVFVLAWFFWTLCWGLLLDGVYHSPFFVILVVLSLVGFVKRRWSCGHASSARI